MVQQSGIKVGGSKKGDVINKPIPDDKTNDFIKKAGVRLCTSEKIDGGRDWHFRGGRSLLTIAATLASGALVENKETA